MPTSITNLKNLILLRIGEPLAGGPIAPVIDTLWSMYSDKALIAPRLQQLYVLVEAINIKIGLIADGGYMPVGTTQHVDLSDKVPVWAKQRDEAKLEIARVERLYSHVRPPVIGTLTTTAPISPADDARTLGALDANDRPYRGDAYLGKNPGVGRII